MKHILLLVLTVAIVLGVASCRTTEENYRAAYQKALAGREDATPIDSTIYGKVRRQMRTTLLMVGSDTLELRTMFVNPTPDDNEQPTTIPATYGVVVGQFKTLFNARSMRKRLADAGYEQASIVNTAEPYYYVVASWHPTGADAAQGVERVRKDLPVALREPLPFVLQVAKRQ